MVKSYFASKYRMSGRVATISSVQLRYFERFMTKFLDLEQGTILEVGSGTGEFGEFCNLNNLRSILCEPDRESFEFMRNRLNEPSNYIELYNGDLSFVVDNVDLSEVSAVVAFDVFEHIDFLELCELLEKLKAKIAKPFKVIARVPNVDSFASAPYWYGDYTHVNGLGFFKAIQLANMTGAASVQTHSELYPFYSLRYFGIAAAQFILDLVVKLIYRVKGAPSGFHATANHFIELSYE